MNKIILLAFILLPVMGASGQNELGMAPVRYERGYVYLKNGSVLKGKYLFSSSLEKVRVISGKNSWIFDAGEVEKITMNRPPRIFEEDGEFDSSTRVNPVNPVATAAAAAAVIQDKSMTTQVQPKWFNLTELGVLAGNNDNSQPAPLVFGTSFNRRLTKNLSAGAGVGAEFLKETYMPVTANVIYKLRDSGFTPFAMLQAGYQVPIEDSRTAYYKVVPDYISSDIWWPGQWPNTQSDLKAKGGFLVNPSFGLMKQSRQGTGWSLSFGYRFHRLKYTASDDYRLDVDFNRLSVKLGIIIN